MLVDTSVWVEHFRRSSERLVAHLGRGEIWTHPFVIGELACGRLNPRVEILGLLRRLPRAPQATDDEVLDFVERHRLDGGGIGWIDAHLLASAALGRLPLWTLDRRLTGSARRLGLGVTSPS